MSLYAIKNDKGKWLAYDDDGNSHWGGFVQAWSRRDLAEIATTANGGHVVPLVEKPAPIAVSEKEAKMLESAKADKCPITHINNFSEWYGSADQDRLMRAYVNGWVVEKPKLWNVKVPHVNNGYYYKDSDGLAVFTAKRGRMLQERSQFTLEEIEHYGLQDCEKTEVPNED